METCPKERTVEVPRERENFDELVDNLLRDKDFLLTRELKHKVDELNQLLMQAQRQGLKVEVSTSDVEVRPGSRMAWLDVRVFKEL